METGVVCHHSWKSPTALRRRSLILQIFGGLSSVPANQFQLASDAPVAQNVGEAATLFNRSLTIEALGAPWAAAATNGGLSVEQRKRAGLSQRIDHHRPFRRMSRRPTISIDRQHVTLPQAFDRKVGLNRQPRSRSGYADSFAPLLFMPFK